jgi:hypothetical protein
MMIMTINWDGEDINNNVNETDAEIDRYGYAT